MGLVLSHVVDLDTLREPRRLALHDRFAELRSLDLYVRRRDLAALRARDLAAALAPLRALAGRLESVRVFHPPYAPRASDGGYDGSALAEVERVVELARAFAEATATARAGISFHHVTEWPADDAPDDALRARLACDRERGRAFVAAVVERCARAGVAPLLENVAPVRNAHPFEGARLVPRHETGFSGPRELAQACAVHPELRIALDVCHLALGCEARRAGELPPINALELEGDASFDEPPPYRFAAAFAHLAPYLDCVHVSGCAGPDKAIHEGGEPGAEGDRVELSGCLAALAAAVGDRPVAVTIEVGDGHTDAGFPKLLRGLLRASAALGQRQTSAS
jgi:hypothetical protein